MRANLGLLPAQFGPPHASLSIGAPSDAGRPFVILLPQTNNICLLALDKTDIDCATHGVVSNVVVVYLELEREREYYIAVAEGMYHSRDLWTDPQYIPTFLFVVTAATYYV
jgi:hypothetical protein